MACASACWAHQELRRRGFVISTEVKGSKESGKHLQECANVVALLKACAKQKDLHKGTRIHVDILKRGLLEKNCYVASTLVNMYAKCGALAKAAEVLAELPVRTVVAWNALIAGYVQQGQCKEALNCFHTMQSEGLSPNAVTFTCILKAYGSIGAAQKGEHVHHEIVKRGLLGKDLLLGTTLVDMYAKCGALPQAVRVLNELPVRNAISWSALITGYAGSGQGEEALKCFERMQSEGHFPDRVTFISILKACGNIGAAEKGDQIHHEIVRQGLLGKDVMLGTTLVDMYAKCGALAKAARVLCELPVRDVVTWSVLITGYATQGQGEEALSCFEEMQRDGLSPDTITLACVLNACSRSGLLDEGQMYFANMSTKYGITPDVDHHTCMVELFGRAGEFDKALAVIKEMPSSSYVQVWRGLLGACRECGNLKLGRLAFDNALEIDKDDAAAYVLMTNIYAVASIQ